MLGLLVSSRMRESSLKLVVNDLVTQNEERDALAALQASLRLQTLETMYFDMNDRTFEVWDVLGEMGLLDNGYGDEELWTLNKEWQLALLDNNMTRMIEANPDEAKEKGWEMPESAPWSAKRALHSNVLNTVEVP